MRINRAVSVGTTALAALVLLTGCGDDDPMAGLGLPSASDMASLVSLINEHAACQDLEADPANWAYMKDEAKNPAWGIKERAYCEDEYGDDMTLLLIDDMQKFQEQSAKGEESWQIGQDFAIAPVNGDTIHQLAPSKMMLLSCSPDLTVPSGYKKVDGLVDGCVMTDYLSDS
ncbi:hypothetical protein OG889_19930 [Streptomyces sp. NBC_00481]|uniref:hypothetical protein n=1 Tax=unclassified Streptomyces TaxID=2593676 RepID=UPI002DD9D45F|nr:MULTISPECIES: hypothetical protein [unclassified Streptomyces]WRY96817.1 hypothetical protein OG889_19930 [Streptomyces sp. NBC_00481]